MSRGSIVRPLRPGQRVWLNHTTGATSRTSTAARSGPLGQEPFALALTPAPAPVDAHRTDKLKDSVQDSADAGHLQPGFCRSRTATRRISRTSSGYACLGPLT